VAGRVSNVPNAVLRCLRCRFGQCAASPGTPVVQQASSSAIRG
jgi:hypothetical protein